MPTEDIKLVGFDILDKKLHQLPLKIAKTYLRQATVDGAKVIQNKAEQNLHSIAKVRGGRNIVLHTSQSGGSTPSVKVKIGPSKRKWFLKFLETGTVAHTVEAGYTKGEYIKAGYLKGITGRKALKFMIGGTVLFRTKAGFKKAIQIIARPYLRPAISTAKTEALKVLGDSLGMKIEQEFTVNKTF
jgi:HK97 gp10 family phage protein